MAEGKIHSDYFNEDLSVNDYLARLKASTRKQTREEAVQDSQEEARELVKILEGVRDTRRY
jgi:hypothetical protein